MDKEINDDHIDNLAPGPIFDDVAPSSLTVHQAPDPDALLAEIRKLSEKLDVAVSGIRDISRTLERIARAICNI